MQITMPDIGDVSSNVVASAITFALGAAFTLPIRWMQRINKRKVWRVRDESTIHVVLSTSSTDTLGEYRRMASGVGQIKAFGHLSRSFYKYYPKKLFDQVYLSDESVDGELHKGALILIGGPNTNRITRCLLDMYLPQLGLTIEGNNIVFPDDGKVFLPKTEDGSVTRDYGVLIASPNPYNKEERCLTFFGAHTYGTEAAARYFARNDGYFSQLRKEFYVAVVEANIHSGHVGNVSMSYFKNVLAALFRQKPVA